MDGVDPLVLNAWLSARSIARGLPGPIADHGGFRVDTKSETEVRRWVFPRMGPGISSLALTITEPHHLLKLCGEAEELRSVLSKDWDVQPTGFFMQGNRSHGNVDLPAGYEIKLKRTDSVVEARVMSGNNVLAAHGYAAETSDAFIYDRIVTDPEHRRKGLGRAIMCALQSAKQAPGKSEMLIATPDGGVLYATRGWLIISPFSTAAPHLKS